MRPKGGKKLLNEWLLEIALKEYEQKRKRQADPNYMQANSQWLDEKYDYLLKRIKMIYTLLILSSALCLLSVLISFILLFI